MNSLRCNIFGKNNLLAKSVTLLLTFSVVATPFTYVFAQEATVTPDTSIPSITPDDSNLGNQQVVSSDTLQDEVPPPSEDPKPVEEIPPPPPSTPDSGSPTFRDSSSDVVRNQFNVLPNQQSGALTYEFPLSLPPGRNNLTPNLSLEYNSQIGEDISNYGFGWSDNIAYIERINKKGSDSLYDLNYFYSSVNGELATTSSSTAYTAKVENGQFLTYSFSNNGWTAIDKLGTTYKYGLSSSTRQDNVASTTQVYKWMLEEVRDTNNNYIKYTYYKDSGQIYPSDIKYTGNGITDGIFEVDFLREGRTDIATSSKAAFSIVSNYRVNEIDTKVSGVISRKYLLGYTTGDNGKRSLLNTITESGRDSLGTYTTLPSNTFTYEKATTGFTASSTWLSPFSLSVVPTGDEGVRIFDLNGDGLPDIVKSQRLADDSITKLVFLNTGNGFATSTAWNIPVSFSVTNNNGGDEGVRIVDVNGDGLMDILKAQRLADGSIYRASYLNTGTGFATSTVWESPLAFHVVDGGDEGVRIVDLNGDGLPDIIKSELNTGITAATYINTGNGFATSTLWNSPVPFHVVGGGDGGTRIADVNGDGLPDILNSLEHADDSVTVSSYINTGRGFATSSVWNAPFPFTSNSSDTGTRIADINGDGLPDILKSQRLADDTIASTTLLNTGAGFATSTPWKSPLTFNVVSGGDEGTQIVDINGDGLLDIVKSERSVDGSTITRSTYINNSNKTDLLIHINNDKGGGKHITYTPSTKYLTATSSLANPNFPYSVPTVSKTVTTDRVGGTSTLQYAYEGGRYYFNNPYERKIAGFSKITATNDLGYVTKTYYHQGTSSDPTHGEYADSEAKIGKPYRIEQYDANSNLYQKTINKWDSYDQGYARTFVKLAQTVDFNYSASSTDKDKAEAYTYDNGTGNQTQKIQYGQVTGSDDGTFSDTGSDDFTTNLVYASSTTSFVTGLPYDETTTDHGATKIAQTRHYYDSLSLGNVSVGNETKTEKWKSASSYINTQKSFNGYGLVTQELDPRGKQTSYTHDTYNLYPATSTNALGHNTEYQYDYASGKVTQLTDPNNLVFQTVYDGLNRPLQEKQPNIADPATLVTKTAYVYVDATSSLSVHKTDYLDASTTVDTYSYIDGLGRVIQEKRSAEGAKFTTKDRVYNKIGLIGSESLPYFTTSSASSTATTTSALFTAYTYDPLGKINTSVNAVGTTTNTYANWKTTITDPRGKVKDLYVDAYNNLVQVGEHNSSSIYSTYYTYNGLNKLTKVTDANSNVRNFAYDGLGRRLSAEDLHAVTDTSFGSTTFAYDDSGNTTQQVDAKNQTINYTYDDINRPLTEDYTGQGGTEIAYGYDTCTNGKGRLCVATTTASVVNSTYDALGHINQETKKINGTNYVTATTYDRQGNITNITYPDNSQVKYAYNIGGFPETVTRKETTDGGFVNLVNNFDYSPQGQVLVQVDANNATTTNTYDPNALYRLSNKLTAVTNTTTNVSTITTDATSTSGEKTGASTATWSHTVGGSLSNSILVVGSAVRNSNNSAYDHITGCTWNSSQSFTSAKVQDGPAASRYLSGEIWYLKNPASGTHNIVCTYSTTFDTADLSAASFSGVDQTSPINSTAGLSTATGNPWTTSITIGVANAVIFNSIYSSSDFALATNNSETKLAATTLTVNHNPDQAASAYRFVTTTTSYTTGWNNGGAGNDEGAMAVVSLKPSSVTSTATTNLQNLAYTYDANGNITQITDTSNTNTAKTVVYGYDDLNRLTTASTTSATTTPVYNQTFSYDPLGNIVTGSAGTYSYTGSTSVNYANPHAVTSIVSAGGSQVAFDATSTSGEKTGVSSVTFSHTTGSLSNRLLVVESQVRNSANSVFKHITGVTYNGTALTNAIVQDGPASSRYLTSEIWYLKNPPTGTYNVVVTYAASVGIAVVGGISFSGTDQTTPLDATAGNANTSGTPYTVTITTAADNSWITNSLYTASDNAMSPNNAETQAWQVQTNGSPGDRAVAGYKGAITPAAATVTGWNNAFPGADEGALASASWKPIAATTTNYYYDNNGNLASTSAGLTNTWDYRNQLTKSVTGASTVNYSYDENGNRLTYAVGSATTTYPNQYYNTTGATTTKQIYANGQLVATLQGTGASTTPFYVHTDHLTGSNIITDASGTVVQTLDYYPYGSIRINNQTSGFDERRKFTGKEYDSDTGLTYYGARYNNTNIGKFISEDPSFLDIGSPSFDKNTLSDPQSLNSYAYARNNPINNIDPDGKNWTTAGQGAISSFTYAYNHPFQTAGIVAVSTAAVIAAPVAAAVAGAALGGYAIGTAAYNAYNAPNADSRDYYLGQGVSATLFTALGIKGAGAISGSTAAENAESSASSIHGNSLNSTKMNYGYQLLDRDTGETLKYGITGNDNPLNRYSKSQYNQMNARMEVQTQGSRVDMRTWETQQIQNHEIQTGSKPVLNKTYH